jgi:putative Holliday junction resolvase
MAAELVLAFDYGLRHIGVAVGQSVTGTATPLTTVAARDGRPDWTAIDKLVGEWRPALVIVGLPLNMDESESPMSARARRFARQLGQRTRLPVRLVDERLTSYATRGSEPSESHAHAAALIAETWLNERRDPSGGEPRFS